MKYVSGRIVCGIYTWLGLERGNGRANNPPTHNSNSQLHRTYIHPPLHYLPTTNRPARAHLFLLARPLPRSKPNQVYIPHTILPLTYFIHLPMKMEPIVSSETSVIRTQTPGNYPKRNNLHLEHGESLRTRLYAFCSTFSAYFSICFYIFESS